MVYHSLDETTHRLNNLLVHILQLIPQLRQLLLPLPLLPLIHIIPFLNLCQFLPQLLDIPLQFVHSLLELTSPLLLLSQLMAQLLDLCLVFGLVLLEGGFEFGYVGGLGLAFLLDVLLQLLA